LFGVFFVGVGFVWVASAGGIHVKLKEIKKGGRSSATTGEARKKKKIKRTSSKASVLTLYTVREAERDSAATQGATITRAVKKEKKGGVFG